MLGNLEIGDCFWVNDILGSGAPPGFDQHISDRIDKPLPVINGVITYNPTISRPFKEAIVFITPVTH